MKKEWIWWTAAIILGLSLSVSGCGEKKSDRETSEPGVGAAPSSPGEKSGSVGILPPGGGSEQSPSGNLNEQKTEEARKAQRG